MSHEYQVGESIFRVTVKEDRDGAHRVTVCPADNEADTRELQARLVPAEANTYLLVTHGNHYLAHVVSTPDRCYVNVGGETYEITPPEALERQRRRGGAIDAHQHVTPPMPGQVIKVLVEVGDTVEKGQAVVVVSAMKMESNLTAPYAGVVTAINTTVGAQVMPGDILVDIEEREAA